MTLYGPHRVGSHIDAGNPATRVLVDYIVFSIVYCLTIMFAVLLGATGGVVPIDLAWYRNINPISLTDFSLRLFMTMFPTAILMVLNAIRFRGLLLGRAFSLWHVLKYIALGVVVMIPLLFIGVFVYILSGIIIEWPEIVFVHAFIASSILLVYALTITTITGANSSQFLPRILRSPSTWIAALILGAILMFTTGVLIGPLSKGYFRFFPSAEQFLLQLPDLVFRSLVTALVLPALSLVLVHLGRESQQTRRGLTGENNTGKETTDG